MTEISFEVAIKRGLGRAVLMLREHGDGARYRKAIQHACRNNLAFEPRTECNRDKYLIDVLKASGDLEWHLPRLKEALWLPEYYFGQLAIICARLTELGYIDLSGELYAVWKSRFHFMVDDSRLDGAEALLWLDGVIGWRFVQQELLFSPLPEEDSWQEEGFYGDLVERVGRKAARHAGDPDPALRSAVARFLQQKRDFRRKRRISSLTPTSEAEIWAALRDSTPSWWLSGIGRVAPEAAFRSLASTIPTEPELLARWLRLFWKRPYPLSPGPLLALTEHSDPKVSRAALNALKPIQHPDVRAFAEWLASSDSCLRAHIAPLLATNPGSNDAALLEQVWQSLTEEDEIHDFGLGLSTFQKAQPGNTPVALQIALYATTPCSMCRGGFARQLIKEKMPPDWLLTELAWDCDVDMRSYSGSP